MRRFSFKGLVALIVTALATLFFVHLCCPVEASTCRQAIVQQLRNDGPGMYWIYDTTAPPGEPHTGSIKTVKTTIDFGYNVPIRLKLIRTVTDRGQTFSIWNECEN